MGMEELKKKLQVQLDELEHELHFKLPKAIQHAREFGDLSENAEYKAAKERQSMVQARISLLHQRIMEVDSIDLTKIPHDTAAYGSVVILYDVEKDEKVRYRLVTSEESDPENGMISTVSPIGQALMGKEEGDEVKVKTPTGWRNFEISSLRTIHEQE
jgi:transcription elongation factor GreA